MAMADRHEHPALPPRQGDTDTSGSVAPGASAGVASVSPAAVAPMSPAARAGVAVRRGGTAVVKAVRELWLLPDRFLHVIIHGRAETMAEHRAYVKSRAWVPPGMTDGAEKLVAAAGIAHYLIVARPLKAAMKAVKFAAEKVEQSADRALRFYLLAAFVLILFFLLARYL